jgi:hypothetical protein
MAAYGMGMRVVATFFGPYTPEALTSPIAVFSHNFKKFERLTKLATSSIYHATPQPTAPDPEEGHHHG